MHRPFEDHFSLIDSHSPGYCIYLSLFFRLSGKKKNKRKGKEKNPQIIYVFGCMIWVLFCYSLNFLRRLKTLTQTKYRAKQTRISSDGKTGGKKWVYLFGTDYTEVLLSNLEMKMMFLSMLEGCCLFLKPWLKQAVVTSWPWTCGGSQPSCSGLGLSSVPSQMCWCPIGTLIHPDGDRVGWMCDFLSPCQSPHSCECEFEKQATLKMQLSEAIKVKATVLLPGEVWSCDPSFCWSSSFIQIWSFCSFSF